MKHKKEQIKKQLEKVISSFGTPDQKYIDKVVSLLSKEKKKDVK